MLLGTQREGSHAGSLDDGVDRQPKCQGRVISSTEQGFVRYRRRFRHAYEHVVTRFGAQLVCEPFVENDRSATAHPNPSRVGIRAKAPVSIVHTEDIDVFDPSVCIGVGGTAAKDEHRHRGVPWAIIGLGSSHARSETLSKEDRRAKRVIHATESPQCKFAQTPSHRVAHQQRPGDGGRTGYYTEGDSDIRPPVEPETPSMKSPAPHKDSLRGCLGSYQPSAISQRRTTDEGRNERGV